MIDLELFNQHLSPLEGLRQRFSGDMLKWLRNLVQAIKVASPAIGDLRAVGNTSLIRDGELRADGSAISRTTYAALFAIYGTTYGAGNGTTTFNLPNFTAATPSIWLVRAL